MDRSNPTDLYFQYKTYFEISQKDCKSQPFLISENPMTHLFVSKILLYKFLHILNMHEERDLAFLPYYTLYPSQPLLYYRFALTYLSYLYVFRGDINKAKRALYQTEKRCVIKDFWRWIIKEEYPFIYDLYEEDWPRAQTDLYIFFIIESNKVYIIPHWAFFSKKEEHYLENWEFTAEGWKRTEAQKLYSQGEVEDLIEHLQDIPGSYNMETCEVVKFNLKEYSILELLYKLDYFDKGYASKGKLCPFPGEDVMDLAILPFSLSSFISKSLLEIKEDVDNQKSNEGELIKELRKEIKKDYRNIITLFEKDYYNKYMN